jgi:GR25 family glycosyltransferase involved in LPS biosynthesis
MADTTEEINFEKMPMYVINLDRRQDRWETFSKQKLVAFFTGLERFPATDGKYLDQANDKRISLHTRENIRNNIRRSHYEINTVGACGASFSHAGCWEKFLATEDKYCMIIEDDCMLRDEDFKKAVVLSKRIPSDFDIWILGYHQIKGGGTPIMPGSPWQNVNHFTGAHCYIIKRNAAEILLKEVFPIETHIEFYMVSCSKTNKLKILKNEHLRVPQLVEETLNNDSDTVGDSTCPLCKIPSNPTSTWVLVPISSLFQAAVAAAAVGFVTYGYFKKMRC